MIQRIQSIWLFLAALVSAGLLYFNIYSYHTLVNGVDTVNYVRANEPFMLFIIAILLIILPLVTIFMFKNRKRQKGMIALNIVAAIGFIAAFIMTVGSKNNGTPAPTSGSYSVAAVLPVFAIVFLFLALNGIRKDEKLVKSLDRLR